MIKTKPGEKPPTPSADVLPKADPKPDSPANSSFRPGSSMSADVTARLDPYIQANAKDHEYYTRLVKENPDRAVRSLMLKDLDWLEREVTLKKNHIAGAKEWLEKQSPETKQFIEERLKSTTHPAQREMALLNLVLGRMKFDNSQTLAQSAKAQAGGPRMAAAD